MDGGEVSNMNEVKGKKIVQNIVDQWSKVYINQVFFVNQMGNVWCYEVEFSKPKNMKPIPEGTVKVFFTVMETADGGTDVEFNFENESLKHKEGNTMRTAKYEVSNGSMMVLSIHNNIPSSLWSKIFLRWQANVQFACISSILNYFLFLNVLMTDHEIF